MECHLRVVESKLIQSGHIYRYYNHLWVSNSAVRYHQEVISFVLLVLTLNCYPAMSCLNVFEILFQQQNVLLHQARHSSQPSPSLSNRFYQPSILVAILPRHVVYRFCSLSNLYLLEEPGSTFHHNDRFP